jgi:hypothetical protein
VSVGLVSIAGCHRSSTAREQVTLGIPRDAARFSISTTSDSTVTFRPVEVRWLKVGMRGHAVDPTQRDALIARLTIQRLDSTGAVATIDGRVAQVSTTHVVLMVKPSVSWWRDKRFWTGIGTGVLAGVVGASAAR